MWKVKIGGGGGYTWGYWKLGGNKFIEIVNLGSETLVESRNYGHTISKVKIRRHQSLFHCSALR